MRLNEIVLIGPSANAESGRMGGVTIPFEEFSAWCRLRAAKDGVRFRVCPLTGRNRFEVLRAYLRAILVLLWPHRDQHVSLHLTWNGVVFFAPCIVFAKMISRKSISMRKFAGDFDSRLGSALWPVRKIVSKGLAAMNTAYFETHYLVEWARQQGYAARWWPNSRAVVNVQKGLPKIKARDVPIHLIYLGRINVAKGVRRLITIAKDNPQEVVIEAFGPVDEPSLLEEMAGCGLSNLKYGGLLPHERVAAVVAAADALVLPTGWPAEGYPGVIIEAAMVGTPVLVSGSIRGPVELVRLLGAGWVLDFEDKSAVSAAIQNVRKFQVTEGSSVLAGAAQKFNSERVFAEKYAEILA